MATTDLGIIYPDATSGFPSGDWWKTLATTINAAIKAQTANTNFAKDNIPDGSDLNTFVTPGVWKITATQYPAILNMPPTTVVSKVGILVNVQTAPGVGFAAQMFHLYGSTPELWWRVGRSSGVWNPWVKIYPAGFAQGDVPNGTDVDAFFVPGIYKTNSNNLPTITGLPSDQAGILTVSNTAAAASWGSQTYAVHGPSPELWWRVTSTISGTWNAWVKLYPASGSGSASATRNGVPNLQRLQAFHDAYPLVSTGGKGAVVFRYDHGLTNFKNVFWPMHQGHNLPAHITMNSRTWDQDENSGATQADAKAWIATGLVEFSNHTATHENSSTADQQYDNVAVGRQELEAQLGVTIHGFIVPGVSGDEFNGFVDGRTLDGFSMSTMGQIVLAQHAFSEGQIVQAPNNCRWMDGVTRQGGSHHTYELDTFDTVKTYIDYAASHGYALTLMLHPRNLNYVAADGTVYYNEALVEQVLAYVDQQCTAGALARIGFYQSHHATTEPI